MGFPDWTLWGMGISLAGALITITLAWLGQSPQMTRRLGLGSVRLDLRVRAFTGYALALLLLGIAFFLAGVPLESPADAGTVAQQDSSSNANNNASADSSDNGSVAANALEATPATPETGAFSGPPASRPTSVTEEAPTSPVQVQESPESASVEATGPITATAGPSDGLSSATPTSRPTETATPIPTATPFPTLTPTAIVGETAVVSTNGSTLWLKRSPGGLNLVLVRDGDVVLLLTSRANQGGILWRLVTTLNGVEGWLQDQFLVTPGQ
jgi:cytoskeletal protein RodZ